MFLNTRLSCGALALLTLLVWSSMARAEKEQFAYELGLSGSQSLMSGSGFSGSSSLPGDMAGFRNNPWLQLTNTSKDASLNRFVMSIGDEDFNYSSFQIGSQVGTFDIDVNIIDGGNNLELVFADFNPAETVYVQFQLRPDDASANQFPDFRNVLFEANGTSTTNNAELTAEFSDAVANQDLTLNGQLPNYVIGASDLPASCAICTCFSNSGSTMQVFNYSQADSLDPIPPVPEPTSWVLMLLGAAVAGFLLRKSWLK